MKRAFDVLIVLWMMLIGAILFSGGGIVRVGRLKLEVSELAAWVVVLILLALIRRLFTPPSNPSPLGQFLKWAIQFFDHLSPRAFWPILGAFALLLTWVHIERHWTFRTGTWDLAIVHQTLYRLWTSAPYTCDVCANGTYLADHLAFILAAAAPFAGIFRSHEILFLLQSVLMASGVALLIQRGPLAENTKLWVLALALVLCHPALRNAWVWDFREDHFAFVLLSIAAIAALRGEKVLLIFSSVLVLASKENMAFILPGLYLASAIQRPKDRRWTLTLLGLAVACGLWAYISFHTIIPGVQAPGGSHEVVIRFPGMGSTPSEVVGFLLTHPGQLLKLLGTHFFSKIGLRYTAGLLGPWIYLGYLNPVWLIAAAPGFLMNLISANDAQRSLQFHYDLVTLPFLALAALQGMSKAGPKKLAVALLLALLFSGRWPGLAVREFWPSLDEVRRVFWLKHLPQDGVLAADDPLIAHVSLRDDLRLFSPQSPESDRTGLKDHSLKQAQWILLDRTRTDELHYLASPEWVIEDQSPDGRLVLLGKTP